ncbi:alpha/beta hydrolase family protein [Hymenobacter sp. B81]|uniref:alpha/beta hydrolase family protein n=1 Tax=Hymenobacter sp. B81 TaxID=3344878 RepID=UPI0037DD9D16
MKQLRLYLAAGLLLLAAVACKKDDYLRGIDKAALFAPPTAAELAAVQADWAARDLTPRGYQLEQTVPLTGGAELRFISFLTGPYRTQAAVLVPGGTGPHPVQLQFSGFTAEPHAIALLSAGSGTPPPSPFILAWAAFRGQGLHVTVNGRSYDRPASEGPLAEAFDGATNDAQALLNVVLATVPGADAGRIALRGGSRGGTVALLLAERDARVRRAIDVVGPTDLLGLTEANQNDPTYKLQFLQELKEGRLTLPQARHRLLASSPLYFAERLPLVQLHLGSRDYIVPPAQGERLQERLQALGRSNQAEYHRYEGRDHHGVHTHPDFQGRVDAFLAPLR